MHMLCYYRVPRGLNPDFDHGRHPDFTALTLRVSA